MHIYICIHFHKHRYINAHIYVHIHKYTYINAHTHTHIDYYSLNFRTLLPSYEYLNTTE